MPKNNDSPVSVIDDNGVNEYRLKFGVLDDRSISVTANVKVKGDKLYMIPRSAKFIPDIKSWFELITVQKMEDDKNEPIEIISFTESKANLNRKVLGTLKTEYTLDLILIETILI